MEVRKAQDVIEDDSAKLRQHMLDIARELLSRQEHDSIVICEGRTEGAFVSITVNMEIPF